jgi:hypothetical protein
MSEVRRLEGCKTQQMRDLINAKARDLTELCAATHVPAPDLGPMLAEVSVRAQAESTSGVGRLADVLGKLVHMLAEVGGEEEAARQGPASGGRRRLAGGEPASWSVGAADARCMQHAHRPAPLRRPLALRFARSPRSAAPSAT